MVEHILVRIQLAHHIARAAPTCKVVSVAARNAIKVRQFSGEVHTFAHRTPTAHRLRDGPRGAARQPARALRSLDRTVKLFNVDDGAVLRTFTHHTEDVYCLALLPDGLRFVSGSVDKTAAIVEHGLAM